MEHKTPYPVVLWDRKYGETGQKYHDDKTILTENHIFKPDQELLKLFMVRLKKTYGLTLNDLVKDGWHYSGGLQTLEPTIGKYHNKTHYKYFKNSKYRHTMLEYNILNNDTAPEHCKCVCGHKIKNVCLISNKKNTKVIYVGICCIHQLDEYFKLYVPVKKNRCFSLKCLDCHDPIAVSNRTGRCKGCNKQHKEKKRLKNLPPPQSPKIIIVEQKQPELKLPRKCLGCGKNSGKYERCFVCNVKSRRGFGDEIKCISCGILIDEQYIKCRRCNDAFFNSYKK